jgi:alpha-methylacyl-CoA racemase
MTSSALPLTGIRIVSLALNLPGPAALMRLRAMGAQCTKVEGPAGDPMGHYSRAAYAQMHEGVSVVQIDLKSSEGLDKVAAILSQTDVLMTSFRPSALRKLGLDWDTLHPGYPHLAMVSIVGSRGTRAEEPGHDLTYMAAQGLVNGTQVPPTLFADMAGSLAATEAVLQAVLLLKLQHVATHQEIALADAAAYLALPRAWGITAPNGAVGGGHAAYGVYNCQDGRVGVAALEPHFAKTLAALAGLSKYDYASMMQTDTREILDRYFAQRSCKELNEIMLQHDIPMLTMPCLIKAS